MAETVREDDGLLRPGAGPDSGVPLTTPLWFSRAISVTPETVDVNRGGRSIRAYRWGDPDAAPVVLLHGAGANSHWWDHVAPQLLTDGLQVITMDLAGHGGSGYCDQYTLRGWADDVMAVCAQLSRHKPLLVGHSLGGRVAWMAAELYGGDLQATVTVDSPMPLPAPQPERHPHWSRPRQHRVYADRDEIVARFRPTPDQPVLPYVRRYIAERSVRQVSDGWTWAHHDMVYRRNRTEQIQAIPLQCPLFVLVAEKGTTTAAGAMQVRREVPQMVVAVIPDAGHHVMLDRPLVLVGVLRLITGLVRSHSGAAPAAAPGSA